MRPDLSRQSRYRPGTEATRQPSHYVVFYKPYGVLSDSDSREKRPTVRDYIDLPDLDAAGRLDQDSEGLMLLTDDGRLGHRLTHPRHKQPKTYLVQVEGVPDDAALTALRSGVPLKGKMTLPAQVELLSEEPDLPPRAVPVQGRPNVPLCWLRIILNEGRKRQVRHMTAAVGHPTLRLVRVAIGPLSLGRLQPGEWRELTDSELTVLRRALRLQR